MGLALRFLVPLSVLASLPLACSSTNEPIKAAPLPPGGSSSQSGGAAGMTAQGGASSGSGGMAGGSGGGGTVEPGGACTKTPECGGTGFFCNAQKVCGCAVDTPDICGAAAAAVCTQKMTDPDNCGMCGMKCDAGAVCVAGKCGAKPTDVGTATGCGGGVRMASDGKNLYWTESKTGKVRSMPLAGGAIADVATAQLSPTQIVVDDKAVYWANQGDGTAASSKVLKKLFTAAPADMPTVLVTASGMDKLPALAVNKGKVYYSLKTDVHEATLNAAGDSVMKDVVVGISVNYDGGKMDVLGDPKGIAATDTAVVWTTPGDRNAVESHTLPANVTDATTNKVGYGKLGKSVGALLETGDVAIDAMYGYWANGDKFDRDILTAQEGMSETITTMPESKHITAFALASAKMYASIEDGRIVTHSLTPPADPNNDMAPPTLLARDQMGVTSLVLDATKLYWITTDCMIRSTAQ